MDCTETGKSSWGVQCVRSLYTMNVYLRLSAAQAAMPVRHAMVPAKLTLMEAADWARGKLYTNNKNIQDSDTCDLYSSASFFSILKRRLRSAPPYIWDTEAVLAEARALATARSEGNHHDESSTTANNNNNNNGNGKGNGPALSRASSFSSSVASCVNRASGGGGRDMVNLSFFEEALLRRLLLAVEESVQLTHGESVERKMTNLFTAQARALRKRPRREADGNADEEDEGVDDKHVAFLSAKNPISGCSDMDHEMLTLPSFPDRLTYSATVHLIKVLSEAIAWTLFTAITNAACMQEDSIVENNNSSNIFKKHVRIIPECVAVMLPNSVEYMCIWLACVRSGPVHTFLQYLYGPNPFSPMASGSAKSGSSGEVAYRPCSAALLDYSSIKTHADLYAALDAAKSSIVILDEAAVHLLFTQESKATTTTSAASASVTRGLRLPPCVSRVFLWREGGQGSSSDNALFTNSMRNELAAFNAASISALPTHMAQSTTTTSKAYAPPHRSTSSYHHQQHQQDDKVNNNNNKIKDGGDSSRSTPVPCEFLHISDLSALSTPCLDLYELVSDIYEENNNNNENDSYQHDWLLSRMLQAPPLWLRGETTMAATASRSVTPTTSAASASAAARSFADGGKAMIPHTGGQSGGEVLQRGSSMRRNTNNNNNNNHNTNNTNNITTVQHVLGRVFVRHVSESLSLRRGIAAGAASSARKGQLPPPPPSRANNKAVSAAKKVGMEGNSSKTCTAVLKDHEVLFLSQQMEFIQGVLRVMRLFSPTQTMLLIQSNTTIHNNNNASNNNHHHHNNGGSRDERLEKECTFSSIFTPLSHMRFFTHALLSRTLCIRKKAHSLVMERQKHGLSLTTEDENNNNNSNGDHDDADGGLVVDAQCVSQAVSLEAAMQPASWFLPACVPVGRRPRRRNAVDHIMHFTWSLLCCLVRALWCVCRVTVNMLSFGYLFPAVWRPLLSATAQQRALENEVNCLTVYNCLPMSDVLSSGVGHLVRALEEQQAHYAKHSYIFAYGNNHNNNSSHHHFQVPTARMVIASPHQEEETSSPSSSLCAAPHCMSDDLQRYHVSVLAYNRGIVKEAIACERQRLISLDDNANNTDNNGERKHAVPMDKALSLIRHAAGGNNTDMMEALSRARWRVPFAFGDALSAEEWRACQQLLNVDHITAYYVHRAPPLSAQSRNREKRNGSGSGSVQHTTMLLINTLNVPGAVGHVPRLPGPLGWIPTHFVLLAFPLSRLSMDAEPTDAATAPLLTNGNGKNNNNNNSNQNKNKKDGGTVAVSGADDAVYVNPYGFCTTAV